MSVKLATCLGCYLEMAYRRRKLVVQGSNVLDINCTGAKFGPVVSTVGTGSDPHALVAPRHHWACYQVDDWLVGRYTPH